MKRYYLLLIPAALILLSSIILLMPKNDSRNNGATNPAPSTETERQAENEIIIKNFEFEPASRRIKAGTTITWTNQDGARHDVMPKQPDDIFKASRLLARGESYSVTFTEPGTYEYYCSPHPYMKGVIEVTE